MFVDGGVGLVVGDGFGFGLWVGVGWTLMWAPWA